MRQFLNLVKYGCILWLAAAIGTGLVDMYLTHRHPFHAVYELAELAVIITVSYLVLRYGEYTVTKLLVKLKWWR